MVAFKVSAITFPVVGQHLCTSGSSHAPCHSSSDASGGHNSHATLLREQALNREYVLLMTQHKPLVLHATNRLYRPASTPCKESIEASPWP